MYFAPLAPVVLVTMPELEPSMQSLGSVAVTVVVDVSAVTTTCSLIRDCEGNSRYEEPFVCDSISLYNPG